MPKSCCLETYGCSANANNSELMAGILIKNSFNIVENPEIADLIIINTCLVKDPTVKKIEERIKNIVKQKKQLIITGCMPEIFLKKLSKLAPNASLVSTHHIKDIAQVAKKLFEGKKSILIGKNQEVKVCIPKLSKNKSIGIIQICQGCINECSYCLVKKVKGNLFSFPEDRILKEAESNLQAGAKEIWITSQDNACYGLDKPALSCSSKLLKQSPENNDKLTDTDINLPQLINKISELNHKFFIRIGMMNPSSIQPFTDELIESYKNPKVFKFLHIPLQSGSDRSLKLMNRKYTVKEAISIIDKFKKQFPEIVIATDIIVGFPGETKDDFQETLKVIEKIKPDVLNHSRFWAMKGTEAAKMKNELSKDELKKREIELMTLHAKIALENKQKLIGKEYKVLVDDRGFKNTWIARNENYQLIILRSQENLQGKFLKVKITDAKAHYLFAEII